MVISLANCPPSLRGDVTKWLFEVSTNVFVGEVSSRVRDDIWDRIRDSCKNGRAVMVFSSDNEQHFDFRIHNGEWEFADLEGLKIMRHPLPENQVFTESEFGYSKASKYRKMNRVSMRQGCSERLRSFVSIATTGPDFAVDRIVSIGSVTTSENCVVNTFFRELPDSEKYETKDINQILNDFFEFLGKNIVVFDDINKSLSFLESECKRCGMYIDIKEKESIRYIGKKQLHSLRKHDLNSLKEYYGISEEGSGIMSECRLMVEIYKRLISDS